MRTILRTLFRLVLNWECLAFDRNRQNNEGNLHPRRAKKIPAEEKLGGLSKHRSKQPCIKKQEDIWVSVFARKPLRCIRAPKKTPNGVTERTNYVVDSWGGGPRSPPPPPGCPFFFGRQPDLVERHWGALWSSVHNLLQFRSGSLGVEAQGRQSLKNSNEMW